MIHKEIQGTLLLGGLPDCDIEYAFMYGPEVELSQLENEINNKWNNL